MDKERNVVLELMRCEEEIKPKCDRLNVPTHPGGKLRINQQRLVSGGALMGCLDKEIQEDRVAPSNTVFSAVSLLEQIHGIHVEAVPLFSTDQVVREYREQFFGPAKWEAIYLRQQDPRFHEINNVGWYYRELAGHNLYVAGKIPRENLGLMMGLEGKGLMDLLGTIENGRLNRRNSIELACGNAGLSLEVMATFYDLQAILYMEHGRPSKGHFKRRDFEQLFDLAWSRIRSRPGGVDRHIVAVDLIEAFTDKAKENLIHDIPADVCLPPDKFFEVTGLTANSMDFIFMNLAFDRLPDLKAALTNMKLLSKLDGSTQFMFGFFAPFSPKTISFSQNPNVPNITCFNPQYDMRSGWSNLSRGETMARIIADLSAHGFQTTRLAEQPYEVYSPHAIIEPAGILRSDPKYTFLRGYDFKEPTLNARRDAIFAQPSPFPDHQLVGLPEREDIVLISGKVIAPLPGQTL